MAKFHHVGDDEWQYPEMKGYKLACCDCGLVHNVDFEVYKDTPFPFNHKDVPSEEGYRVRLLAERNERSTTAMRREDRKRKKYRYRNLTEINLTIEGPDDYKEQVKTLVREMVKHNLLTSDTSDVALAFIEERDETGNPKEAAGTEG